MGGVPILFFLVSTLLGYLVLPPVANGAARFFRLPVSITSHYSGSVEKVSFDRNHDGVNHEETYSLHNPARQYRPYGSRVKEQAPRLECGINPSIRKEHYGAHDTVYGEYPWQVAIFKTSNDKLNFLCSGALLSGKYVITAANCIDSVRKDRIKVRLGDWDILQQSCLENYQHVEVGVDYIHLHPHYDHYIKSSDVAVLSLKTEVDLKEYPQIAPICLPSSPRHIYTECWVAGWKESSQTPTQCPVHKHYGPRYSQLLEQSQVKVEKEEWCHEKIQQLGRSLGYGQQCIVAHNGDPCKADPGSPVMCKVQEQVCRGKDLPPYEETLGDYAATTRRDCQKDKMYLVGVVSWSFGCQKRFRRDHIPGQSQHFPYVEQSREVYRGTTPATRYTPHDYILVPQTTTSIPVLHTNYSSVDYKPLDTYETSHVYTFPSVKTKPSHAQKPVNTYEPLPEQKRLPVYTPGGPEPHALDHKSPKDPSPVYKPPDLNYNPPPPASDYKPLPPDYKPPEPDYRPPPPPDYKPPEPDYRPPPPPDYKPPAVYTKIEAVLDFIFNILDD